MNDKSLLHFIKGFASSRATISKDRVNWRFIHDEIEKHFAEKKNKKKKGE